MKTAADLIADQKRMTDADQKAREAEALRKAGHR